MKKQDDKWICRWDDIDTMVAQLLREMTREKYKPDFIVGISRGGLVPAIMLSHQLNVPMLPVVWSTRDFIAEDRERIEAIQHHVMDESKQVLIVDDICDTGATFEGFQKCLMEDQVAGFAQGVEFCSLYVRYSAKFNPTFYAVEIPDDAWIVFPFESQPQRKI